MPAISAPVKLRPVDGCVTGAALSETVFVGVGGLPLLPFVTIPEVATVVVVLMVVVVPPVDGRVVVVVWGAVVVVVWGAVVVVVWGAVVVVVGGVVVVVVGGVVVVVVGCVVVVVVVGCGRVVVVPHPLFPQPEFPEFPEKSRATGPLKVGAELPEAPAATTENARKPVVTATATIPALLGTTMSLSRRIRFQSGLPRQAGPGPS
jgi:hypothetical protein